MLLAKPYSTDSSSAKKVEVFQLRRVADGVFIHISQEKVSYKPRSSYKYIGTCFRRYHDIY